jgi:hypothetical protein
MDKLTEAREALEAAAELFRVALPQFNWGASALNADAYRLLNEAPGKVTKALARLSAEGGEG